MKTRFSKPQAQRALSTMIDYGQKADSNDFEAMPSKQQITGCCRGSGSSWLPIETPRIPR